jgi:uncharacterized membrane protein YbhN (UPF0104 family)
MERIRKFIKIAGYPLSIFFLYLTFRDTNFSLIVDNLKYIHWSLLFVAAILYLGFIAIRAQYQRNNLVYIKRDIAFSSSITSVSSALFFNVIFPARIGEIIRAFYLSNRESLKKASLLSYILVEKLIDFLFMLVLLGALVFAGFRSLEVNRIILFSSIIVFVIVVFIFVYIRFNRGVLSFFQLVIPNKLHGAMNNLNTSVLEGFRFYKSSVQVLRSILMLTAGWSLVTGVFWCISYNYIRVLALPPYSPLFFIVFASLSLAVPSAPAGIGVVHYGLYLAIRILTNNTLDESIHLIAAFILVLHFFTGIVMDLVVAGSVILYAKLIKKESTIKPKKVKINEETS